MRRRNRSRYANRPAIIKRLGLRERIRSAQPLITQTCDKKKENPVKKTRTPNQRKNSDNQKEATDKMANIDRTRKRVIVVGAGISGLACARELHERNFNVLVLEARHRSGGRLKSVPMRLKTNDQIDKKGFRSRKNHPLCQQSSILNTMTSLEERTHCPVDMGGAFIHGNDGNPIQELADRIGISTSRAMRGEDCHLIEFQNSGWPIAAEADFKAQERFNYILDQTFLMCNMILDANLKETKTKLKIPTVFTKDVSFGAVFEYVASDSKAEPLARPFIYSRTGGFPKDTVEALLFEWHVMNLEMSTGTTLDQLGLRWNDDEAYGYEGDHVLLKEGFSSILEGLEEGLDIKYGNEVSGIRVILGDGGMTVPIRKSTRKRNLECSSTVEMKDTVEVRTVQGLTFEADAVVCTLPLGILSIPEGEKGYISFYPPLPKPKCDAIEKLGFGYYNKCAMTFSESFWGSSADFIGVVGAPFAGSKILFCNASVAFGLPVIVMIYGGAYAKEVEDLSDEVIVSECIATLQRVCNSMDIPLPIDYCVTRWGKDKFSRGAFSYCPVGVDGEKEMGILSQPILGSYQSNSIPCRKPLLLFAGEATSPFHPSTIHGAYLSGIREAYRLDLSVYPEENNNISFDETFLYKRTFSLRKRFKRKANEETQVKSSLIKCRTKLPSNGSNRSNKPNQHVAGVVRKSRRLNSPVPISKSVTSSIGVVKDERTEQSETASTFSIIEDIALLRGIDMFGKDTCAIKNIMFPVPETYETNAPGRIRSFDEIRARLDELISGGAATAKGKGSEKIHDIWKVSTESEKWWKKIESEKDQMKKTPNGDRRESSRKSKRFQ